MTYRDVTHPGEKTLTDYLHFISNWKIKGNNHLLSYNYY